MITTEDRELLVLAAKAADVDPRRLPGAWPDRFEDEWNPLIDDGDALRLAVKLNFGISIPGLRRVTTDVVSFHDSSVSIRECGPDPYAATRRAIVRAAADVGRRL